MLLPWVAFDRAQLLFDPVYLPVTLAAIYVSGSALGFMQTERERREIRSAFALYLSPDQVDVVARNPAALQLGGQQREITVMFTDVRGFTRISEQFDPAGLTRFMNRFLTPMTDLIQARRGTIDKYMGDAIMAFWNAPFDVERHAAARLRDRPRHAGASGRRSMPSGRRRPRPRAAGTSRSTIGIGLNTGQATVGNFGSEQRLDLFLPGRRGESRLAPRGAVQGLRRRHRHRREHAAARSPDFATLELDLILVKGKTEPVRMYALLGDALMAGNVAYRGWSSARRSSSRFIAAAPSPRHCRPSTRASPRQRRSAGARAITR